MFKTGDRVIFNGGKNVFVPIGSGGTIIKKKKYDNHGVVLYEVCFDAANGRNNKINQVCETTSLILEPELIGSKWWV